MQVVGDPKWLDDRIATLKMDVEYHHRRVREIEDEIAIMKQQRDAGCHYSPARYPGT